MSLEQKNHWEKCKHSLRKPGLLNQPSAKSASLESHGVHGAEENLDSVRKEEEGMNDGNQEPPTESGD